MDSNIKLSNVIGAPFADYVLQQLAIRANRNTRVKRDVEDVLFLANKSAWARLVSSVDINGNQSDVQKFYANLGEGQTVDYDPQGLARNWILEAGTSIQNGNGVALRQGIGVGNFAYGLGGTNELGFRPMPGLTSIQVETLGRLGSLRQATVTFKVWNINQLNVIEALYFRLGYSMLLEWGHTQYFNNINTSKGEFDPNGFFISKEIYGINDPFTGDKRKLAIQQEIAQKSRDTSGNYDGMLGIVSNFNWSFNQDGGYDCTVRMIGPGAIMNTVRVNQVYTLPDGTVKRYLRNQELIARRIAQAEEENRKNQERLQAIADKAIADAAAAKAAEGKPKLPPAPKNFTELTQLLVDYDGHPPSQDIFSSDRYQVNFVRDFIGSEFPYQVGVYALFNSPRSPTGFVTSDARNLVHESYRGFYPRTYTNSPFGNITPGRANTVPARFLPQVFNKFAELVVDPQRGRGANNPYLLNENGDTAPIRNLPGNYKNSLIGYLGNRLGSELVSSAGVQYLAAHLALKVEIEPVYGYTDGSGYTYVIREENIDEALDGNTRKFAFAVPDSKVGEQYFKGSINVVERVPKSSESFPVTRRRVIEVISQYLSGNGVQGVVVGANISETRLVDYTVVIKGTLRFVTEITNPQFPGEKRSYYIDIVYETNNGYLFEAYPSAPQPEVKKADAGVAGGGSGVSNKVSDKQTERSDGFQSALHAMLTIVQAEVQANAAQKSVAYLSIGNSATYKTYIENFFQKGILNGVIGYDPSQPPANSNPDLKYAAKGFNANLMLNPNLLNQIPSVDFDVLTRAFIVRIDQDTTDTLKDTVRCPVYISFGFLLAFLSNMCIIYDSTRPMRDIAPSKTNDQRPYFYIDFNPDTNLCLTFPQQFSVDPFICLMPFSATKTEYLSIFPSTVPSGSITFDPTKNNVLREALEKGGYAFQDQNNTNQGKIMKILLNVEYLLNLLSEFQYSDPEHAVNLQPFLERILVDIGKCTGNANYFKLTYRDDANTLQIIDYQVTPKLESEKTIINQAAYDNERLSPQLQSRILSGELPVFGSGSIAREFQLKTTISTSLAKMIAISASPDTTSINATDHTSFSTLNELYKDRYKPYPGDAGSINAVSNNNAPQNSQNKNDIKAATLFDTHVKHVNSNFEVSKDDIELAKNYYIERISKVKAGFPTTAAAAPIPANAELTIDGISGIVMYNAFTIPEERLPLSLRGINGETRFGFIVSGLTHTIENNQWLTKLSGQMFPLRKAGSLGRRRLFELSEQKALPGIEGASVAGLENIGGPCERSYSSIVEVAIRTNTGFAALKQALMNNGFNSTIALASILAVAGGESGWNGTLEEDFRYSDTQLANWFGLNPDQLARAIAARSNNDRDTVFGIIYGENKRNGNRNFNDGASYLGRGFIQLTGYGNYQRYGNLIGVDLLNSPESAAIESISAKIAVAYYKDRLQGLDINSPQFFVKALFATGNPINPERKVGLYNCLLKLI